MEAERRHRVESATAARREAFRSRTQSNLDNGKITYAQAREAENAFRDEEAEQTAFELHEAYRSLQSAVTEPGMRYLEDKIESGNACINMMHMALSRGDHSGHSNGAQVEGDEEPELLEQLTLLKWLFEGREHAHKALFDMQLLEKRSAQMIPHSHNRDQTTSDRDLDDQLHAEELQEMQAEFADQAYSRFAGLQSSIERHVSRGVEEQISAFWDIAPQLLEVVQQVPSNLRGFEVLVPAAEVAENPSYSDFNLQYLLSNLNHAQKSAYQFIESQTNLLCLRHEVQTASMAASTRMIEIQRLMADNDSSGSEVDMGMIKQEQESMLTAELKEKVGEVERQWDQALGGALESCKGRVRAWLIETGGWDDGLEE